MKIKVLKRSDNELRIEIVGEGHSFCNALQKTLLEDRFVDFAGYRIPHPLIPRPIIYLRTKGSKNPEEALTDAAKALGKKVREIRETLEEGLREEK